LPKETKDRQHSWYLYTVRLKDGDVAERDTILQELREKGVGAAAYYVHPVHLMPYYRENFGERTLPETEKAAHQVFSLPIHPGVTEAQVDYIGKTLLSLL
jgi:perosamine synthetase